MRISLAKNRSHGAEWNTRSNISTGFVRVPVSSILSFSTMCGSGVNGASPSVNAAARAAHQGMLSRKAMALTFKEKI